jgi:hypothetical protein
MSMSIFAMEGMQRLAVLVLLCRKESSMAMGTVSRHGLYSNPFQLYKSIK